MIRRVKNVRAVLFAICGAVMAVSAVAEEPTAATRLDSITVQTARDRQAIERQVSAFVSGIAVAPYEQSLANWQSRAPICPLVAGMPREDGEYMLSRISRIAAAAGAPLAGEHCKPNFYVIVTSESDALLKAWGKRDKTMFGDADGTPIHKFLTARTPVRAWYNAEIYNSDGTPLGGGDPRGNYDISQMRFNFHADATRIRFNDVRNLSSVLVLIDAPRAKGTTFGQLAAYIAMIGIAEIRLDARPADAPSSILQLFASSGRKPPGLSAWDEAFLKALYHTEHLNQHQLSAIKSSMVQEIAPH
jgi:hypothetical protein